MIDSRSSIKSEIESMNSIGDFIVANEEIAANSMRRIRNAVVNKRDFISELTSLYNEVKANYKSQLDLILTKRKKKSSVTLRKNGTACVLLSSNATLYGEVVNNAYRLFSSYFNKNGGDVILVGKIGRSRFERDYPGRAYKYFDYPDNAVESPLIKPIVLSVIQYDNVVIFHSKFQSLLKHTPTAFVLSETEIEQNSSQQHRKYLFEPSLDRVIDFFEKEIFGSIVEQTMSESHLSKFASRMVTLDAASENIKRKISDFVKKERQLVHREMNKRQVNSVSRFAKYSRK